MGFLSSTSSGLLSNTSINYPYIKEWEGKILERQIIIPESKSLREINVYSDKGVNLYWGNQTIPFWSINNQIFVDNSTATSLSIEPLEGEVNVKILIRSTKVINYELGGQLMIPVKVRLALGTGENFTPRNTADFDSDSTQYLINLYRLKNSDSGATGFKVFDIFVFYPGKKIDFDIIVENPANYGNIALQLFDPISIGEALFDVANDMVNLELNNISDSFIGNITRNALYKDVVTNKVSVWPDFSRHAGRFIAINNNTNSYDTAIIKSYTPNSNALLGGTFTLTGSF